MDNRKTEELGRVLEVVTVNMAVHDSAPLLERLQAMGFHPWTPVPIPQEPFGIVDTSVSMGDQGVLSVVNPTSKSSSIERFLEARGLGLASISVRVDDLTAIMARWGDAGVKWWKPEPYAFRDIGFGGYFAEIARVNWTDPRSLWGLSFEVVEFDGAVRPREDWEDRG